VDLSSDGSPLGRLPDSEREWLADAHARLIVPLAGAEGRPLGVLVLGEKRSELPYTREDRQLVATVAASAAVALEQRLRRESPDPKPSNIGYTGEGLAKLLDFGLVRLASGLSRLETRAQTTATAGSDLLDTAATAGPDSGPSQTPMNRLVGTAAYLSPEAVSMGVPTAAVDLWALAVTLYEALTRRNPFAAPSIDETLRLILRAAPPDPREARADCPQPLASFLVSALAADRRRRPASALDFRQRLEAARGG
jgi:serine/threonine-protein kinase